MRVQPKNNISSDRAIDLLKDGQPLIDVYISGDIIIETIDNWDKEVFLNNCVIEYFSGSVTHFEKSVKLTNCVFKKCQFVFSYFLGGLLIDNCTFDNFLDFQAGGHNKTGNPIMITNNEFRDFVNFFDCWYENEVTISNNNFQKGTNLLGKPYNIPVTFDKKTIIKDNIGQLNMNSEGKNG